MDIGKRTEGAGKMGSIAKRANISFTAGGQRITAYAADRPSVDDSDFASHIWSMFFAQGE